jgi:hypothetical protein
VATIAAREDGDNHALPSGDARWTLFAGLWGWALLMHQATFDRWRHSPLGWALVVLAIALVLRPSSLVLLAAVVTIDLAYSLQCMPQTANHLVFEGMVCFGWLLAFGAHAFARLRREPQARTWWRALERKPGEPHPLEHSRAPLCLALLLVYWLSVLHKLNYDFVDPAASCASYMYRRVAQALPFLPRGIWAEHASIWGTLLAEATLPVLLLWRRTWQVGLVAALSFHLMLALDPTPGIYSFTGLLFALFVLVLPKVFVAAATERLQALVARVGARRLLVARGAALLAVALGLANGALRGDGWAFRAGFYFFVIWAAVVAGGYLLVMRSVLEKPAEPPSVSRELAPAPAWLWTVPAIVLLNGFNPYLGLRTQLSFSMFSNLRTEGGQSNHWFMPRLISLGHFQEDLVEIIASDDAELAEYGTKQLLVPYFEFRRMVSGLADVNVTYRRGGLEQTFRCSAGHCNDAELAEPYSRLLGRLLYFRPVDKGPRMLCRH